MAHISPTAAISISQVTKCRCSRFFSESLQNPLPITIKVLSSLACGAPSALGTLFIFCLLSFARLLSFHVETTDAKAFHCTGMRTTATIMAGVFVVSAFASGYWLGHKQTGIRNIASAKKEKVAGTGSALTVLPPVKVL